MAFALIIGVFIILRAMWQGRRAEREIIYSEIIKQGKA
jgi:hypothetical protein